MFIALTRVVWAKFLPLPQRKQKRRSRLCRLRPNFRPLTRGEGGKDRSLIVLGNASSLNSFRRRARFHQFASAERFSEVLVDWLDQGQRMGAFKINFLVGLLIGVALAILAPLAGADVIAALSAPAQATSSSIAKESLTPQSVNREAMFSWPARRSPHAH